MIVFLTELKGDKHMLRKYKIIGTARGHNTNTQNYVEMNYLKDCKDMRQKRWKSAQYVILQC